MSINGKESVKLQKGIIEFENHFKQTTVPFKIYTDFECNLKGVECYEGFSIKKKIKITFIIVFLTMLLILMIGLLSQLLFIEAKMKLMN